MQYAVCEINGKQYKVEPNKPFEVDLIAGAKDVDAEMLLFVDSGKLSLGKPFLKEKLKLKVLTGYKKNKIRVAKFHAKANYRKVTGSRRQVTQLVYKV